MTWAGRMRGTGCLRGARERWRRCGVVRPRRRLPLRPFPCPRPVDRFATGQRCPERRVRNAAHLIRRSGCCWRDQREDLGVGPFVRAILEEVHPLAWSIACGGLRVGRTRRGQHGPWQRAARRRARSCSSKAPRAAAAVHVVHGTWWRGCWGRASGGPAAEDISARSKYKGSLARAIGSVASRAYLLRQVSRVACPTRRDVQVCVEPSICTLSIRTEDLGELKVERRFRYIIFDSSQVTSSHNRSLARSAIWRATRGVFPLDMIPLCPPGRGPRAKARPAPQAHILLVLRDRIRSNRPTGRRRF